MVRLLITIAIIWAIILFLSWYGKRKPLDVTNNAPTYGGDEPPVDHTTKHPY